MTDTFSPTFDVQMPYYQHAAYQRLLLAEMGITPWVGQSESGEVFSPETLLATLAETVENQDENSLSDINQLSPTLNEPTNFSQTEFSNATIHSPTLPTPTLEQRLATPPLLPQPLPAIYCHYYAIKVQHWVILADGEFLNSHSQARTLWQNMTRTLSARQYEFRFPFNGSHSPNVDNSNLLAQASFAGFLCAIERGSYLDNGEGVTITKSLQTTPQLSQKIGIVTPIPDWLENEAIRRLPYLTEMLEDYRQKRQFWQLMIANET